MTVFVDEITEYQTDRMPPQVKRHGAFWSHMWSDNTDQELHDFAKQLGLKREWFQPDTRPNAASSRYHTHYDITPAKRAAALRAGAVFMPARERAKIVLDLIKQSQATAKQVPQAPQAPQSL